MNITNNKGFTLVEILAVIIVLAAIFMVSFPAFLNTAKTDEERKYDDMVKTLCLSGQSYIYTKKESYEDYLIVDNVIEITIKELIAYGSVDGNLEASYGDEVINGKLLYTVLDDYSLNCEYISE